MKKVMVIPGGVWQVKLLDKLREKNIKTLNTSPSIDSPGFKHSDYHGIADAKDREKNLALAKEHGICAILTDQSDIAVPTVAYVAESLGISGIGSKCAKLFSNKLLMRQFLYDHGLKCPRFKVCRTIDEAKGLLNTLGRIVIKPIDSQSSRGVFVIESETCLVSKFEIARGYSNSDKVVLAEEYISGPEFTVDGIKFDDCHYTTAISIKEAFYKGNDNISQVQYFTHYHPEFDYNKLRKEHNSLVEQMGLKFGLTHAEYKYFNGQFYLIEIGARGGGSNLSGTIVPYMSDIDHYQLLIRMAMGERVSSTDVSLPPYSKGRHAILEFWDFGEGTVSKIEGENNISKIQGVLEYNLEIKNGDVLRSPGFGRERPGYYIAVGKDRGAIESIQQTVKNAIKVKIVKSRY